MNTQIVHIIVEIRKFNKTKGQIQNDLDKLIYTMKNVDRLHEEAEIPEFYTEEWIDIAIKKLQTIAMTAEQRMQYSMAIAKNASVKYMMDEEIRQATEKAQKAKEQAQQEAQKAKEQAQEEKRQTALALLQNGAPVEVIAKSLHLSTEFIHHLSQE